MNTLENTAIRAIFDHQYNTEKAIRFVSNEANVSKESATQMIRKVMLPFFGKQSRDKGWSFK